MKGMFEKACTGLLRQFDDPNLQYDSSIAENRPAVEAMQQQVCGFFRTMAEASRVLAVAQKASAEAASIRAKETAKDAAEAAAAEKQTNAAAKAAPQGPQPSVSRAAARHMPRTRGLGAWSKPLALALEKPVDERTGEDVIAAARATKVARTGATAEEQMEADIAALENGPVC